MIRSMALQPAGLSMRSLMSALLAFALLGSILASGGGPDRSRGRAWIDSDSSNGGEGTGH